MRSQEPEIGRAIREEKVISDGTDAALRKAIEFYAGVFRGEDAEDEAGAVAGAA
jgi:hypothetical protein